MSPPLAWRFVTPCGHSAWVQVLSTGEFVCRNCECDAMDSDDYRFGELVDKKTGERVSQPRRTDCER